MRVGSDEHRPRQVQEDEGHRQQEEERAEDVDPRLRLHRQPPGDDVDAYVLVTQQRVARTEQEDRGEEVPLRLEERVGAHVEELADDRVDGAEQDGREHEPGDPAPDVLAHRVDEARNFQ